jgi:hypothetical protein
MKRYLDEDATAQMLRPSRRTLQRRRRFGGGPAFIRTGARRVLYDVAEIERWAAERTFAHRAVELAASGAAERPARVDPKT